MKLNKAKELLIFSIISLIGVPFSYADSGDATPIGSPAKVSAPTASLNSPSDATLTDIKVSWTLLTDSQTAGSPKIGRAHV